MPSRYALWFLLALAACGPGRTTYARFPGAPAAFDRTGSNPQAVEIADKVLAAAGGAASWEKAKQIRWTQTKVENGAVTARGEQAWDRWNGRLYTRVEEPEGSASLAYDLYGTFSTSYRESKAGKKTPVEGSEKAKALVLINAAFQTDLTVMFMPFLMLEPGTKLDYAGVVKDGEVEYHDLKISFGSGDTTHADLVYHAIVDKTTYVIRRVDVTRPTTSERLGFELSDWTETGGLKLPGTRKNLGSGELAQSKDIKVGSPDDTLYMAPLY